MAERTEQKIRHTRKRVNGPVHTPTVCVGESEVFVEIDSDEAHAPTHAKACDGSGTRCIACVWRFSEFLSGF